MLANEVRIKLIHEASIMNNKTLLQKYYDILIDIDIAANRNKQIIKAMFLEYLEIIEAEIKSRNGCKV